MKKQIIIIVGILFIWASICVAGDFNVTGNLTVTEDVSIGTTNAPSETLDVYGNVLIRGNSLIGNDTAGGDLNLQSTSDATKGRILFGASASYDEANKVLNIGTTTTPSPGYMVNIDTTNTTKANGIFVTGTGKHLISRWESEKTNIFQFRTFNDTLTTAPQFTATRGLGSIGTKKGATDGAVLFNILGRAWGAGQEGTDSAAIQFISKGNGSGGAAISDDSPGEISFRTVPDGSGGYDATVERMRIDSEGNVGIGTTNPGEKLDVNGSVKATGYKSSDGSDGITKEIALTGGNGSPCDLTVKNGLITATDCQ